MATGSLKRGAPRAGAQIGSVRLQAEVVRTVGFEHPAGERGRRSDARRRRGPPRGTGLKRSCGPHVGPGSPPSIHRGFRRHKDPPAGPGELGHAGASASMHAPEMHPRGNERMRRPGYAGADPRSSARSPAGPLAGSAVRGESMRPIPAGPCPAPRSTGADGPQMAVEGGRVGEDVGLGYRIVRNLWRSSSVVEQGTHKPADLTAVLSRVGPKHEPGDL